MALALVMLMGAFIKICSLHTKSDNPNLVPHRDFPGNFSLLKFCWKNEIRTSSSIELDATVLPAFATSREAP